MKSEHRVAADRTADLAALIAPEQIRELTEEEMSLVGGGEITKPRVTVPL